MWFGVHILNSKLVKPRWKCFAAIPKVCGLVFWFIHTHTHTQSHTQSQSRTHARAHTERERVCACVCHTYSHSHTHTQSHTHTLHNTAVVCQNIWWFDAWGLVFTSSTANW